ncbi:MAG: FkbM family methyltransferase, partial [Halioglobus sp.]
MFKPDVHGADPTILNSRGRKLAEQTVGVFYFWVSFSPTHGGHFHPCEIEEKIRNIEYNFDGVFNFIYSFRLTQAGFFTVEIGSISNLIHRFYAQNGEDYLLAKFFDFTQVGFYVDVGAFDGVHLSNSFCFEQMGWQGICVEPQKFYFDACVKNRPGSICVQAACVGNENKKEITLEIDETGLFSSTSLDLSQSNITGHYGQLDRDVSALGEEIVSASTLNSILKSNISDQCSISFLSIDVEGMEKEVLQGLDLKKYSPKVLVIETNTKEIQMEMTDYLLEYDFQFARQVGANSFYAKSEEDCLHLSTIEITCVIEKQIHPKGLEYTQSTYLHGRTLLDGISASRIFEDSRSFAGQLENRDNKVSKLLRDLDEARLERNTKVGSLLETNEALRL